MFKTCRTGGTNKGEQLVAGPQDGPKNGQPGIWIDLLDCTQRGHQINKNAGKYTQGQWCRDGEVAGRTTLVGNHKL